MYHLNNKGFTLIEILASVTILSILTVLSFIAFSRYGNWSKKKAYDYMAKSASTAAEQYVMDYSAAVVSSEEAMEADSYDRGIKLKTLVDKGYLNNVTDPKDKSKECAGRVVIGYSKGGIVSKDIKALDKYMYVVYLCCETYKARYVYDVKYQDVENTKVPATATNRIIRKYKTYETVDKEAAICD